MRTFEESLRQQIKPNDVVLHRPTGETWVVCGVNHSTGEPIPCGYPFPSIGKIADCELLERRYEAEPQTEEHIRALLSAGYPNFVDYKSAELHGIVDELLGKKGGYLV